MKILYSLLLLFLTLTSFDKTQDDVRLTFKQRESSRSSFCMYSDGKFYETFPSGCLEHGFSHGRWENKNDTIVLDYQTNNIFNYEILKSADSGSQYQIIRIVDCYDQPVHSQWIYTDTIQQELFNPGMLKIDKGKIIVYIAPTFENDSLYYPNVFTNSDTVTYKWHCNRESIESINGGRLFAYLTEGRSRRILRNKWAVTVP